MSHGIGTEDNVMLKNSAWHRLGTVVGEAFSWARAKAEGLPITLDVVKVPVADILTPFPGVEGVTLRAQADEYASVGSDGLVIATGLGKQATIFHAEEGYAFGQCIRDQYGEGDLLSLGTLYDRRRWFMTFDLGSFSIGDYAVRDYLSVNGSYDGSWALTALSSPIVEVCANTVAFAESQGIKHYRFKHTSGIFNRVDEAKRALITHRANRDVFVEIGNKLLATKVSQSNYSALLATVFPTDEDVPTKTRNVNEKAIEFVTAAYKSEQGSRGVDVVSEGGNGWAVVQAVNTYENWAAPVKVSGGRSRDETVALRQVNQLQSGKQPLTAKALALVGALN